eukprot:2304517-Amphidinium_carterae.1
MDTRRLSLKAAVVRTVRHPSTIPSTLIMYNKTPTKSSVTGYDRLWNDYHPKSLQLVGYEHQSLSGTL